MERKRKMGSVERFIRSIIYLVTDRPASKTTSLVLTRESNGEVRIYFRPERFMTNRQSMMDVLNGLVCSGTCAGFNIDMLMHGIIWVYFNPTYHDAGDRRRAIKKIAGELRKHSFDVKEEVFEKQ